jgi:hypothetical protein
MRGAVVNITFTHSKDPVSLHRQSIENVVA